ncbi:hypothetical protein HK102_010245, partial [Quaeritorhiza haematococci]
MAFDGHPNSPPAFQSKTPATETPVRPRTKTPNNKATTNTPSAAGSKATTTKTPNNKDTTSTTRSNTSHGPASSSTRPVNTQSGERLREDGDDNVAPPKRSVPPSSGTFNHFPDANLDIQ